MAGTFLPRGPAFGEGMPRVTSKHSFEFGLSTRYIEYDEDIDVEWDGFMYGLIAGYTYRDKVMLHTSLEYTYGELEYDGRTQGGTPLEADTEDWIVEWRGLVGYDAMTNESVVTPFVGIGYRYWNDTIEATGGYEREIVYLYSPIGVKTMAPLSAGWTLGITAEYDLFWKGEVKSHLSDAVIGYNDPENDQDSGYGLRFSLSFREQAGLFIEPYIAYWDIDRSDLARLTQFGIPIGYAYEPGNDTTIYGLRLGWTY
jgi:hypothetical protein